ncbi:uncharacterized protein LOC121641866 [Melanotaenia boesemani]|uniref:uncharacterized protein LOC121641866 n=1 Tax=Melanotaenia boesemani TaxID=1250792 RepID=UPI001C040699|nr:uncharacterized protein LOC121641866 [Melanotaenia boesemani]
MTMHITIQEGRTLPDLKRCSTCCNNFHCPFCRSALFHPTKLSKVKTHLQSHFNRAVLHEGYTIHRCGLDCRPQWHYHCPRCISVILRRSDFNKHLSFCKKKQKALAILTAPPPVNTSILAPPPVTTSVFAPTTVPILKTSSEHLKKVHRQTVGHKICPICNILINKKNLKKHIERKHTSKQKDTKPSRHLQSECIDSENGIYMVQKAIHGSHSPLHVQNHVQGETQHVSCESTVCQDKMELAWRNGLTSYLCIHLESLAYSTSYTSSPLLQEETLTEMVNCNWFGEDIKKVCLDCQKLAKDNCVPLSVLSEIGTPKSTKYISIYEPNISFYPSLRRVLVSYDTKQKSWHCSCASPKESCPHKYIAVWHLFETHRELLGKVQSSQEVDRWTAATTEDEENQDETDLWDATNPPVDEGRMKAMAKYILKYKKLPAVLPDHLRLPSVEIKYPKHLIPEEIMCKVCPGNVPLSVPVLVTNKAKILSTSCIVEGVSTYSKSCHQCRTQYRYQEWKDGLHNFNDWIVLALPLCLTIRNMLLVHTTVSRVVEFLELMTEVKFPPAKTVLHGYLHFEALTDHDYSFSCITCGDHPPVVILGFHKGCFRSSGSDLPQPPDFNEEINVESFWEEFSVEMICRGFATSQQNSPVAVQPTVHYWAPWIGKCTRCSDRVLNTEFEKVCSVKPAESCKMTVSEEKLRAELYKQKVNMVRKLCRDCGLDSFGSRRALLMRLFKDLKSRQTYNKVLQKIRVASGGWAVITCPCGIVYSMKCNIQGESLHDFADTLLSWKHMPNIIIYDSADELATHMNLKVPERLQSKSFEGWLMDPTSDSIKQAHDGKLKVSFPWLNFKKQVPDVDGHPITGSAEFHVLYDQFPDNTMDAREILQKLGLVPQRSGRISSQSAEQLLTRMKKNNYFLNMALPSTHMFLMRNMVHHYNTQKNKQQVDKMKAKFCSLDVITIQ